jgi:hypothetical protein
MEINRERARTIVREFNINSNGCKQGRFHDVDHFEVLEFDRMDRGTEASCVARLMSNEDSLEQCNLPNHILNRSGEAVHRGQRKSGKRNVEFQNRRIFIRYCI